MTSVRRAALDQFAAVVDAVVVHCSVGPVALSSVAATPHSTEGYYK